MRTGVVIIVSDEQGRMLARGTYDGYWRVVDRMTNAETITLAPVVEPGRAAKFSIFLASNGHLLGAGRFKNPAELRAGDIPSFLAGMLEFDITPDDDTLDAGNRLMPTT